MAYTTLTAVAAFLNVEHTALSNMEVEQISLLIEYVSSVIDNYCGYVLGTSNYTKRFDGTGTSSLDLGIFPVNSVASVTAVDSSGDTTDYTADIEILDNGTLQFKSSVGGTFASGTSNIYITFNAGYVAIPADIAFAATYLVAINFNRISQDLIGISEQTATNLATKYDTIELPVLVKRVLDRYRKVSIF